ncbi:ABC-three component system protein [Tichowtungia aerotolerans]|uniref:ABC-three component systems C-terminal domain-containing protein n=1 Tax=Tichowtungia aerotolerans TaxID=2697043 RepID=A0A6P1M418_9BACT|nr:ABC-three component system protein [Tichowtungia aerotolerans]QHI68772.1 hypothetical protein GT409_04680 [Tichowtungia aerotolerans]
MATQAKNQVGGDLAGRDIDKSVTNYYEAPSRTPEVMRRLIAQFKEEYKNNRQVTELIERLEHFSSNVDDDGVVIGLETKLVDGGYSAYIGYANSVKEAFAKKLMKYQFYESAQQIYAYVLADIFSKYHTKVYPLINAGSPPEDVLAAVSDSIVDPLIERLGENVLCLYADEINGALYFLTGNCHIKWV